MVILMESKIFTFFFLGNIFMDLISFFFEKIL